MTTAADLPVATVLRRAAERAVLAPSVHNTQPWTFVLRHDSLEIHADPSRQLTVLDPRGRQLMISIGCALFHARVAIAASGHDAIVERFPESRQPRLVARVSVGRRLWLPIAALDPMIDRRRTNRRAFADESLPERLIDDLAAAVRTEGALLFPITRAEHRLATARLSQLADSIEHKDPDYLAELRAWTTDDPRRRDGVQAASVPYLGSGGSEGSESGRKPGPDDQLPVRAFDQRGMGWLPSTSRSGVDQTLLLLCCDLDEPSGWLRTGEALEHVWLELTRHGYWASPLTQVVEVAETQRELRAELGLDANPEILLRVGRAPETVQTRRRDPAEVIVEAEERT